MPGRYGKRQRHGTKRLPSGVAGAGKHPLASTGGVVYRVDTGRGPRTRVQAYLGRQLVPSGKEFPKYSSTVAAVVRRDNGVGPSSKDIIIIYYL